MAAAQREAVEASGFKPRSGKQNAQIGLKGFTQVDRLSCFFVFIRAVIDTLEIFRLHSITCVCVCSCMEEAWLGSKKL